MPMLTELLSPEARERLLVANVHNQDFASGDESMSCACGTKIREHKMVTPEPTKAPEKAGKVKHPRACQCERRQDGFRRDGDVMVHKTCRRPLATDMTVGKVLVHPRDRDAQTSRG